MRDVGRAKVALVGSLDERKSLLERDRQVAGDGRVQPVAQEADDSAPKGSFREAGAVSPQVVSCFEDVAECVICFKRGASKRVRQIGWKILGGVLHVAPCERRFRRGRETEIFEVTGQEQERDVAAGSGKMPRATPINARVAQSTSWRIFDTTRGCLSTKTGDLRGKRGPITKGLSMQHSNY